MRRQCCLVAAVLTLVSCKDSSRSTAPAKTFKLSVAATRGVSVTPNAANASFDSGSVVAYTVSALPGYGHLQAQLDGSTVATGGTITMNADHRLVAYADSSVVVSSQDSVNVAHARQLLVSANPVQTFASLLSAEFGMEATSGAQAAAHATEIVASRAFDPVADSAALRRVDAALNGLTFDVPLSTVSSNLAATQTTTAGPLPLTFLFVNGIQTSPYGWIDDLVAAHALISTSNLPDFSAGGYVFRGYYNATWGVERGTRAFCEAMTVELSWLQFVGAGSMYDNVVTKCGLIPDLLKGVKDLTDLYSFQPAPPDVQLLANRIQAERRAGRGVIVIAHSDGTTLTQEAFRLLLGIPV